MTKRLIILLILQAILILVLTFFAFGCSVSFSFQAEQTLSLNRCFIGRTHSIFIPDIKVMGVITNYHPVAAQTDDTPNITASGIKVREGIVANNCLKFGTLIMIEDLGTFEVQDRMNSRYGCEYFDVLTFDLAVRYKLLREVIVLK